MESASHTQEEEDRDRNDDSASDYSNASSTRGLDSDLNMDFLYRKPRDRRQIVYQDGAEVYQNYLQNAKNREIKDGKFSVDVDDVHHGSSGSDRPRSQLENMMYASASGFEGVQGATLDNVSHESGPPAHMTRSPATAASGNFVCMCP